MKHCYIVNIYFQRSVSPKTGFYSTIAVTDNAETVIQIITAQLREQYGQGLELTVLRADTTEVSLEFLEKACEILRH